MTQPLPPSYTSMRDGDRSPADAAREGSERSHLNPSERHIPGSSCYTSGTILEAVLDIPGPKPNISHDGRVSDTNGSVRDGSLTHATDAVLSESSITVQP